MQTDGRNDAVYRIAGQNYEKLLRFCGALDEEGYWEEPSSCLKQTIIEMLDLYVQSVLVHFAVFCNRLNGAEQRFILNLTENTMVSWNPDEEVPDSVISGAKRVVTSPPILLQLCGLRDKEKYTEISGQFFDAFVNIILCLSHINHGLRYRDVRAKEFLEEYFERIQYFLDEAQRIMINRDYIIKKSDNDTIEDEFSFNITSKKSKDGVEILSGALVVLPEENGGAFSEQGLEGMEDLHEEEDEGFEWEDVDFSLSGEAVKEESLTGEAQTKEAFSQEKTTDLYMPDEMAAVEEVPEKAEEKEQTLEAPEKTEEKEQVEEKEEENKKLKEEVKSNDDLKIKEESITCPMDIEDLKKQQKENFLNHRLQKEQIKEIQKEIKAIKEKKSRERVEGFLQELNRMVGLVQVKEEVKSLINLIRMRKLRMSYEMPNMEMSYHMVFTGNPGTGKTTVARLIAKIYKELGVVSKGTLVETDRAGLVAGYVGQTALKVTEVVNKAIGGILFIDEAYSLTNSSVPNDFGTEAIDTLVKLMEDNRNDLVVIVAGYKKEMKEFLSSNTGLISRFNKFIEFPDYSLDELTDILKVMAKNSGVEFEEGAVALLRENLNEFTDEQLRLFGNARGIRNTFEKIIQNQANRIMALESPAREDLCLILEEDVKKVLKS